MSKTAKIVYRHKNCGGFILPDIDHSFTGMTYGYCPKCDAKCLTTDDYDEYAENDITLYEIRNRANNKPLTFFDFDSSDSYTITFDSEEHAHKFASMYIGDECNYRVEQLLEEGIAVTNAKLYEPKEDE